MSEVSVWIPDDVFSRFEPDGRVFVLRPQGGKPPRVLLFAQPSSDIWRELLRQGSGVVTMRPSAMVRAILAWLSLEGFIHAEGLVPAENPADIPLPEALGALDPWDYQFAMPTLDIPWFALWEITDDCPLMTACHFCYRPKQSSGGPSAQQAEHICEQLERSAIPWVTLIGGEPLVYPGLHNVIERLRSSRIFVKVISNGILVTEQAARMLRSSGVNQVAISLDGLDATTHDLNRGVGAFEKSLDGIRLLQGYVPLVSISLTVTNQVFEQLDGLPEFCARLGIPEVYISPLRITANTRLPKVEVGMMRPDQKARLPNMIRAYNSTELQVISPRECSCGRSSFVIHADGTVSPCPFAVRAYGNIYTEGLSQIWQNITLNSRRIGSLVPSAYCFQPHEFEAHSEHALEMVDG